METELASNNVCTGCSACTNICPKNAIEMTADEEGFLFPQINQEKCIKCGKCRKICPVINKTEVKPKQKCFALMADDEIRYNSSSGGAFSLMAQYVLKNNGYVCGAFYDSVSQSVKHIIVNDINDLQKLRTSKYIQSEIGDCFKRIKDLLNQNKKVLFVGTPCQVSGILNVCGNSQNLITADLICHGIPSQKVFQKYINEFAQGETVTGISFTDKLLGWSPERLITVKTENNEFKQTACKDYYMKAFLNNLSLRKSCNHCQFATINRQSDITIGDFWWIAKYDKNYDDNKGTSLVITNNNKGENLINAVKNNCKLIKRVPLYKALKYNGSLNQGCTEHRNRKLFFANLDKMAFKDNVKKCLDDKFDIGIINFWWATTNYGALLTGYAIQQVLKDLGYTSRLIDNKSMNLKKQSEYDGTFNDDFRKKYLETTEPLIEDKDFDALNLKTKIFITGSDQVFAPKWMGPHFEKYFLEFADIDAKKIAFSASFGVDEDEFYQDDFFKTKMLKALKTFDYISTRENSGVDICKNIFNCDADWIVDPVFIMNKSKYDELADKADIDYSGKIVSYVLDDSEKYRKTYEYLEKQYGAEVVKTYESNISAENWLASIKNCKYFVTDSFHGVCFALIFNKPFVCLVNRNRGYARFSSLIKMFSLPKIYFDDVTELNNNENLFENLDYDLINLEIENRRNYAIKKLVEAIEKPKEIDNITLINYANMLKSRIVDLEEKTSLKNIKYNTVMFIWSLLPMPLKLIIKKYFL